LDFLEYITAFRKASNLSESNEQELAVEKEIEEAEVEENIGLTKALDAYRKLKEANKELTEKEQSDLEKKLTVIEKREILEILAIATALGIEFPFALRIIFSDLPK